MAEPTVAEALKTVHDLKDLVERKLPDIEKGLVADREVRAQFEKQFADLTKSIEDLRRTNLPSANPLAELEEKVAMQRGTLFQGQMKLPYKRAISMQASHPILRESDKDQLRELQDLNDAVVLHFWQKKFANPTLDKSDLLGKIAETDDFKAYFLAMARAGYVRANEIMHPGSAGIGANLNFTILSAQLLEKVRMEPGLINEMVQVPLPRAQTDFPALLSDCMSVLGGTTAVPIPRVTLPTDTSEIVMPPVVALTNPTFGLVSFRCVPHLAFLLWNDDMFEDSVVPWLPLMRDQLARAIARGRETALVNGVRTGTAHLDSDTTATQDIRFSWHGLRKLGNTTKITHSSAVLTTTGLRNNRANMGVWGRNQNDLFHVIHVGGWYQIMKATEVLTVDVFGDAATVKTGTLAKLDGVDLKMSEALRTDLNASGVYDGATLTETISLCVNKTRFMLGTFGELKVEETRMPAALSTLLQAHVRNDFKPMEQVTAASSTEFAAGVTPVSVLYNIDTV